MAYVKTKGIEFMRLINAAKLKNNRGFSLVELVVAIALFAVVVTPVMNTFISSARVNQRARKIMIATDICQDIIEGYSEMTYETIAGGLNSFGTVDLGGAVRFSSVNSDKYNISANYCAIPDDSTIVVKPTTISISGGSAITNVSMISENSVTELLDGMVVQKAYLQDMAAPTRDYYLYGWKVPVTTASGTFDEDNGLIMMVYKDIQADTGYNFNAVVTVFPAAQTGVTLGDTAIADTYYSSYCIKVSLYDEDNYMDTRFDASKPIATMVGGIASE